MLKLKFRGKKGAEQYGDHHQVMVELTPVALGVVIVLILGVLIVILLQHERMIGMISDLAANR